MSFIHKAIIAAYKPARSSKVKTYTIKLHADGKLVHGLEIEDATNGNRDVTVFPPEHRKGATGILVSSGGVSFRTSKGKPFFIKYPDFSFVLNQKSETEIKKAA